MESERDVAHAEARQLAERVIAVSQLVSNEHFQRESAIASVERSLQGMREVFDNERAQHTETQLH